MFKWLSLIVAYIICASVIMGFFVYQQTGETINTLSPTVYNSEVIDFSGNIDLSTLLDTSLGGADNCEIVNNTLVITPPILGDVSIFFKGIQPDADGLYTVEYGIDNTNNGDYAIIITSETGAIAPKVLLLRYNHDNQQVDVIYCANTVLAQFVAVPYFSCDMNLDGNHSIKTEFNINTHELDVTIDDNQICHITITDFDENSEIQHYGGGIISDNLIITYVKTNVVYVPEDATDGNFFVIMAQIIAWNVDEIYLPLTLNILFIKIPLIILGLAIAFYIRGVS